MKKEVYINIIYDYYGNLLTEKQQLYFEDYYFNNLSLGEISNNYGVSRNAIHKQLRNIEKKLNYYETKLNLYKKAIEIKRIIISKDKSIYEKIEKLI